MHSRRISVVIPARNEGRRVLDTIRSMASSRASPSTEVEFIVVDDASTEPFVVPGDLGHSGVSVTVVREETRLGVPKARNRGAAVARGDVLVMTDAHVRFGQGWDLVAQVCRDARLVLAGTVADPTSAFRGYGCSLVVPFMGTRWNKDILRPGDPVHIPSCAATLLSRRCFEEIGGYDEGMLIYGGAEPEFGLRSWLTGVPVVAVPDLLVWHRFKMQSEINEFLEGLRPSMTHNCLRFGVLYLPDRLLWQMFRYHAALNEAASREAVALLEQGDAWDLRVQLRRRLSRDFSWFTRTFALEDQAGRALSEPPRVRPSGASAGGVS